MRDNVELRIAKQFGDHRADKRVVGADALLAEEHDVVGNCLDRRGERLGDSERIGIPALTFDMERPGGSARQTLSQRLLHAIGTEGHHGSLAPFFFLGADGLFERVLVVGRNDELQTALVNTPAVGDLDAGLRVRDLRDAYDDVQRWGSPRLERSAILVYWQQERHEVRNSAASLRTD